MIFIKKDKRTKLEKEIDEQIETLAKTARTRGELEDIIDLLTKRTEMEQKVAFRVSPDTMMLVLGNLAGIALILNYEHLNVITSKALGFVLRRV